MDSQTHYPYVTRSLIRLFDEGRLTNVESILVEPEYGYFARITYRNGSHRISYGNDLGLNPGAAVQLAKDKGYSKFVLREMGVKTPRGREFLMPNWVNIIAPSYSAKGFRVGPAASEAEAYVEDQLGYPVYVKPVAGSKGGDVYRVAGREDLREVLASFEQKLVHVAVIEEAIGLPDYRLVVLDGELISAYERRPMAVVGDGVATVAVLATRLQEQYASVGRDTRILTGGPQFARHLQSLGVAADKVPASGELITLLPVSNLSMGGTSIDVTNVVAKGWIDLAAHVAAGFNLRFCGLDLACSDITNADARYSALEVNATPGLDHYAMSGDGQRAAVDALYVLALNTTTSNAGDKRV